LQVSDAASAVLLDDDGHGHQPIALKRKKKNETEERKTHDEQNGIYALLCRRRSAGCIRPTDNMSTHDFYLRALQPAATYETVRRAEPLLRQAMKLDPRFAAAHAIAQLRRAFSPRNGLPTQSVLRPCQRHYDQ